MIQYIFLRINLSYMMMLKTNFKRPTLSSNIQKRSHSLADPIKKQKNTLNSTTINHPKILTMLGNMKPTDTIIPTPVAMLQTHNKTQNGLNGKFLQSRRQSYLNNGYNNRKNKLEEITTENKKIHYRINSQKTSYSRDQMNKSYESNSRISRRLSQSRISRKSSTSSRSSLRSSAMRSTINNKNKHSEFIKPRKLQKKYKIQTKDIGHLQKSQINKMCGIFHRLQNQNRKPESGNTKRNNHSISSHKNSAKSSFKPILPPISQTKKNNTHFRNPLCSKNDGQFLHRIAQEMFNGLPIPNKK